MAKEIPFFKFYVGEWANGDITCESFEAQGVFINICSVYWTKEGSLSERFVRKRFPSEIIDELIESEVLKIEEEEVSINFLDEQLNECIGIRKQASAAGKASAAKRAAAKKQREEAELSANDKQDFNDRSTTVQPIREEKRREEEIREDKKRELNAANAEKDSELEALFFNFWENYDKKKSKEKAKKAFFRLKKEEIKTIFETLPAYIRSTPDKKFRKDPITYLNQKSFNDEIISPTTTTAKPSSYQTAVNASARVSAELDELRKKLRAEAQNNA